MKAAFAELNLPEPPDAGIAIGPPIGNTIRNLLGDRADELFETTLLRFRAHYSERGLFEADPYPGIREVIAKLVEKKVPLFVATAKLEVFARRLLEHQGLAESFRVIYGSRSSGELSLKSDLVGHVLNVEKDIAPGSFMIGDRHHDIDAAQAHGLRGLGVTWGYGSADELRAAGAHALVHEASQLLEWLA